MRNPRFYHQEPLNQQAEATLTPETSHHLSTVLRYKAGQQITLFCGDGVDYHAEIIEAHKKKTRVKITNTSHVKNESPVSTHLIQAICRGEKMDFIIQKATELGVNEITPVICERTQGARDINKLTKKHEHWQKVMISACEQSGRAVLPTLNMPVKLSAALNACGNTYKIILHTDSSNQTPAKMPGTIQSLTFCVGPEGGFSDDEITEALALGFLPKLLGPRILRTETAALAYIASIQICFGDYDMSNCAGA